MSNIIHKVIMKAYLLLPEQIGEELEESRRWRDSDGEAGARFYLAYENLPNVDLSGAVMFDATLQDADLTGARLDDADLGRALANGLCLNDADCTASCFDKAALVEASFERTDARRASFKKANLKDARFIGADLQHADLEGAVCIGASFLNADLRYAKLIGAILTGADFTGAHMSGVHLDGAVLDTTTRLSPSDGVDGIIANCIHVDGQLVRGTAVRDVLTALAVREI